MLTASSQMSTWTTAGRTKDIPEEVLERVLLQVLLGEVLQVALGEGDLRGEDELVAYNVSISYCPCAHDRSRMAPCPPSFGQPLLRNVTRMPGSQPRPVSPSFAPSRSTRGQARHTLLGNLDIVAHLASLASDLDTVVQKLFKRGGVKDIVGGGDRVVDVELVEGLAGGNALLGGGSFGLLHVKSCVWLGRSKGGHGQLNVRADSVTVLRWVACEHGSGGDTA
jgi:hypothetical protein